MMFGAASAAQAATPTDIEIPHRSSSVATEQATLNIDELSANGFVAHITNGSIEKLSDGSLTLFNAQRIEVATLQAVIRLNDTLDRKVNYSVNGTEIIATYSSPVSPDVAPKTSDSPTKALTVLAADPVNCTLSTIEAGAAYLGAVGAALTAPFTFDGGLVVAGAALGAGAAAANGAYQCYGH